MGDIVGLVEEAHKQFDMEQQAKLAEKMERGEFTLDDFMSQMGQIRKLGPMGKVLGMIPGMSALAKNVDMNGEGVEGHMGRMQAIYSSMNRAERKKPDIVDAPRRRRIARGAGVEPNDVSQFLKQFGMSRDMMRAVGGMNVLSRMKMMRGLMSGDLGAIAQPGANALRTKRSGWQGKKDRNKKGKR
jgi:signal recognition particle subunit SRP54